MPSYKDDPPAFEDASAADKISNLIQEAIIVKSLLADSVVAVTNVDSVAETEFAKGLRAVDQVRWSILQFLSIAILTDTFPEQKFLDLMNESRASAATLTTVIDGTCCFDAPHPFFA